MKKSAPPKANSLCIHNHLNFVVMCILIQENQNVIHAFWNAYKLQLADSQVRSHRISRKHTSSTPHFDDYLGRCRIETSHSKHDSRNETRMSMRTHLHVLLNVKKAASTLTSLKHDNSAQPNAISLCLYVHV